MEKMEKWSLIMLAVILFISCNNKANNETTESYTYEVEETVSIVTDEPDDDEPDKLRKALAEESIIRARHDVDYILENIPLAQRIFNNKSTSVMSTSEILDHHLRETELKTLGESMRNTLDLMYTCYEKKEYKSVVSLSNQIQDKRIWLKGIIEE